MKPILAALALTFFSLPLAAQTVSVDTATGVVEVPARPARVVALDLAAIDTLFALDVQLAGVPAIRPPAYLAPAFAQAETVGTLFEPDFEALAVLGPDLIVAGGRSQLMVGALSRLAPTLDMTIWGSDIMGQSAARLHAYGAIFDRVAQAERLAIELDTALADARAAVAGKGAALILQTNGGTVSAYGAESRFGWLHTATGLAQAYSHITAETHGEAVSFEFIAQVDPDWILVIDRGAAIGLAGEAAAATLNNPLVMSTTAGRTGQIIYLDSAALYLAAGGVQATRRILGQITEAFRG